MAAQARRRHIGSGHAAAGHPCRAVSRVLIIVDDGDGPPQHVGLDLPPEGAAEARGGRKPGSEGSSDRPDRNAGKWKLFLSLLVWLRHDPFIVSTHPDRPMEAPLEGDAIGIGERVEEATVDRHVEGAPEPLERQRVGNEERGAAASQPSLLLRLTPGTGRSRRCHSRCRSRRRR